MGVHVLQAALVVAGLAGVYVTQYGGEGVREAQVLRVGNRYTVKRKNLKNPIIIIIIMMHLVHLLPLLVVAITLLI